MATATHHPDLGYKHASGFGMWALMSTTTPGELADWQTLTSLNGTELSYLGTDNTNGVAVGQTWGWCAAGFVARFTVSEGTPSQIAFTLKGYDPGGCGVGLYAWNFSTGAFVSLASHSGGAPGNWTLTHTISSNVGRLPRRLRLPLAAGGRHQLLRHQQQLRLHRGGRRLRHLLPRCRLQGHRHGLGRDVGPDGHARAVAGDDCTDRDREEQPRRPTTTTSASRSSPPPARAAQASSRG